MLARFSYIEKSEYWALVWGVIVMAGTGVVMWFDNYFLRIFTKLGWDIARTLDFSNAMAGLNCTALGARGGIKSQAEAEQLMATGARHVNPAYRNGNSSRSE